MNTLKHTATATLLLCSSFIFAGGNGSISPDHYEFGKVEAEQNSWDYVHLNYSVNNTKTGESEEIPSSMIQYQVKDKSGKDISTGTGTYINVNDTKLGSEEDYTIKVSTIINGEMLSHAFCKKASPKYASIKLEPKSASVCKDLTEKGGFSYSFTRPKFNNPNLQEMLLIVPSDIYVEVGLQCCESSIKYKMSLLNTTVKSETALLENTISKLVKDGQDVVVGFEPALIFKGEVYKDMPYYYEVTAGTNDGTAKPVLASKE